MVYHFKIHKEKKGYWADCVELKGCITQADNKETLIKNMEEALNLYLDEPQDSKDLFPLPRKYFAKRNIVKVPVEPNIAFAFMLRRQRIIRGLTQKQVAKKLGLKNIYSYQRLEQSKTANPALTTISKIKSVFPKLNFEDIFPEIYSTKHA